jgi:hypothetical protein
MLDRVGAGSLTPTRCVEFAIVTLNNRRRHGPQSPVAPELHRALPVLRLVLKKHSRSCRKGSNHESQPAIAAAKLNVAQTLLVLLARNPRSSHPPL